MIIRHATPADAGALLQIYSYYVTETTVSFEYEVPTVEEFAARIESFSRSHPYLICEQGGAALGYCYAHAYSERKAYEHTAECTVYVRNEYRGSGVGRALYEQLEAELSAMGKLCLLACAADDNAASIAFHKKLGFTEVGHFPRVGFKLGRWLGVTWLEKELAGKE